MFDEAGQKDEDARAGPSHGLGLSLMDASHVCVRCGKQAAAV